MTPREPAPCASRAIEAMVSKSPPQRAALAGAIRRA
jgi:hypothetical protein